ncbi:MAG: response regulator transcription factor [Candidatus Gracilibacteria bacterium]|nr:response regulator transcription factor [Candidatus Gracilibacteria bacterium]
MQKILIIEDDIGILNSLRLYLTQSSFDISTCDNGTEAMLVFDQVKPDLIILDINLPGKNGIEICREIRERNNTPIIILSARGDEDDKIMALDLGADDYVAKPFSPRELLARINSVLKRFSNNKEIKKGEEFIIFKNLRLDIRNFTLFLKDELVKITKTEFELLRYIIENKDEVVLREKIMKDIMGYDNYLYDRTLDTHIKNLRKKIGEEIEIETIRGIGYKVR